jgi:glutathione peroxidase
MRNKTGIALTAIIAFALLGAYAFGIYSTSSASNMKTVKENSIYEFDMLDIDGNSVNLGKYKGKVVMLVNTASKCGYTPQYEGLEKIYEEYKDQGFVILGFPANNFGGQEPGSNAEIKEFCTLKYKVSFPMFAKISVLGEDQHPLYTYLTSEKTDPKFAGDITWNFNKFLVGPDGKILARFASKETPESPEVTKAIESALDGLKKGE